VLVDDDGFAFCYPRTTWKLSKVDRGGKRRALVVAAEQ
jgi:hypothetical protein